MLQEQAKNMRLKWLAQTIDSAINDKIVLTKMLDFQPGDATRYMVSVTLLFGSLAAYYGCDPRGGSAIVAMHAGVNTSSVLSMVVRFDLGKSYLSTGYVREKVIFADDQLHKNMFAQYYTMLGRITGRDIDEEYHESGGKRFPYDITTSTWVEQLQPLREWLRDTAEAIKERSNR